MNVDNYLNAWAASYRESLTNDILPFWLRHGLDRQNGGVYTCVNRDGSLIDSTKSVWFQGRFGFITSYAYNHIEKNPEWLAASKSCIDLTNASGAFTYRGCLTKPNMDVLMIRDKFTHEIVARSILFRTKNSVMLAPFYGTNGFIFDDFLQNEVLQEIGNKIMSQAKEKGDSIDENNALQPCFNNNLDFDSFVPSEISDCPL